MRPEYVETLIIDEPSEVSAFLDRYHIPVSAVLEIRNVAHGQMMDCSPLMAANAPGTLAYHFGVLELRVQLIGDHWEICRDGGIESVISPDKSMKVGYQNVDLACSRVKDPCPRSEKGPGAEREFQGNLFDFFNVAAPKAVRAPKGGSVVFSVMVDDRGAVEVSRPIVEDGKFTGFIVRAFVSDGSDLSDLDMSPSSDLSDPIENFDVAIESR